MPDIYNPQAYASGIPYDTYAKMRIEEPISWQDEPPLPTSPAGPGFWAVMRYGDARFVCRNPDIYSASLGGTQLRDPDPADLPYLRSMLLNMDPPTHNKYRKVVSRTFSPANLAGFDRFVADRVATLLEPLRGREVCDVVTELTDEVSLSTLTHVLGVPATDRKFFFDWANRIIGYHDDEYVQPDAPPALVDQRRPSELTDMMEYARSLAEYRRRNPGDDLLSALVHTEVEGRRLTDAEFENFFFLLAVAGNDTTRSALPGALIAFMDHPNQYALLRAEPQLIDTAVEECLRYAPPVIHFRRTATVDTTLGEVAISAGDKVVFFYPSANRDPEAFDAPDEFDIRRTGNAHLSFGHGPHVCVAAALARIQMKHVLGSISQAFADIRPAGPPDRLLSNFVAGIKHLPIALGS
ncbi:cytochrome P450 [Kutzneria sp. CA-103260]|uniref:cytochrome P450 n=1 Tax=Kutzneria sp. CA-103260 TaxID=2802641 RepID=UPI001BAABE6C|nr:cytochrome P450 [Kutzneria sp. CA-103260]QUQ67497.1 cytochrome P450 [Kutzneria sp. CA-103260]